MIDIHTHLHPERLALAIRRWFDENSTWNLKHPFDREAVVDALKANDVERFVFCSYAHKPGIARDINKWLAETARDIGGYGLPLFTVHLDDPCFFDDAKRATEDGCIGLKIHEDVQSLQLDDPRFEPVFSEVERIGGFVLAHMGPVPWRLEPEVAVSRVERVLKKHPALKLVLAHMGAPDTEKYMQILERYEGLYLDTTMVFSNVPGLRHPIDVGAIEKNSSKILFGTDYPNIPYAYDLEQHVLKNSGLSEHALQSILGETARKLLKNFL